MSTRSSRLAAGLAAAALCLPAAALAHGRPDGAGPGSAPAHGKGHVQKPKNYVFKGTITAIDTTAGTITVNVARGNHWAKRYLKTLSDTNVVFSVTGAKLRADDTNGNGTPNELADMKAGDNVLVQARLPRDPSGLTQPLAARRVNDLSSAKAESGQDD